MKSARGDTVDEACLLWLAPFVVLTKATASSDLCAQSPSLPTGLRGSPDFEAVAPQREAPLPPTAVSVTSQLSPTSVACHGFPARRLNQLSRISASLSQSAGRGGRGACADPAPPATRSLLLTCPFQVYKWQNSRRAEAKIFPTAPLGPKQTSNMGGHVS